MIGASRGLGEAMLVATVSSWIVAALVVMQIRLLREGLIGLAVIAVCGVAIYLLRYSREAAEDRRYHSERGASLESRRAGRLQAISDELSAAQAASARQQNTVSRFAPAEIVQDAPSTDNVIVSVFAPASARPGQSTFSVTVALHTPEHAETVEQRAVARDAEASNRGTSELEARLREGDIIRVELDGDGGEVEGPVRDAVWNARARERGRVEMFFRMSIPGRPESLHPTVTVYVNGAPVGFVRFQIEIKDGPIKAISVRQSTTAHLHQMAFISYASEDREQALRMAQTLRIQDTPCFLDILDLDPGVRWQRELYRRIDECDLFILMWSDNARRSEWVIREAEYALASQERKEKANQRMKIAPYVLEGPPHPQPPPSLQPIMMDDRLQHMIFASRHTPRYRDASPPPIAATSPTPGSAAQ